MIHYNVDVVVIVNSYRRENGNRTGTDRFIRK
jgi:hypothetical protein